MMVGARYDLTDVEWLVIEPLLPRKWRGVKRVDDRRVLNGLFWVLRSGAPWRDLPERYGPYTTQTVWKRSGESVIRSRRAVTFPGAA
jgi:transposase